MAPRKTWGHPGLCNPKAVVFLEASKHHTSERLTALKSVWTGTAPSRHLDSRFPTLRLPGERRSQGPPSSGRQPRGHRTTKGSAARRVLSFKSAQASCRRKARCAEVRSVTAAPLRFLGPRFPTLRLPGERRDPGTTELWMATKRTSDRQGLRGTEGAFFQERSSIVPAENPLH